MVGRKSRKQIRKDGVKMRLMDCTLRDGANVIGKGFDAKLTTMMIEGLKAILN